MLEPSCCWMRVGFSLDMSESISFTSTAQGAREDQLTCLHMLDPQSPDEPAHGEV